MITKSILHSYPYFDIDPLDMLKNSTNLTLSDAKLENRSTTMDAKSIASRNANKRLTKSLDFYNNFIQNQNINTNTDINVKPYSKIPTIKTIAQKLKYNIPNSQISAIPNLKLKLNLKQKLKTPAILNSEKDSKVELSPYMNILYF